MNFNLGDVTGTLLLGVISSIFATFIYDNWLRNKTIEPAHVFNDKNENVNTTINLSKCEFNRRIIYRIFVSIFTVYLIWACLYLPLIIKVGFFSNDVLDLTKSNLAHFLRNFGVLDTSFLIFNFLNTKWVCLFIAILLYLPCMFFQSKIAILLIKLKNNFYNIENRDWDIYRGYGLLIFSGILLLINIYLISLFSFLYSAIIAIIAILLIILKANER